MYFRLKHLDKYTNDIVYDVILETTEDSGRFKVIKIIENDDVFGSKEGEKVHYSPNFLENRKNNAPRYEITYYEDKFDFIEHLI